MIHPDKLFGRLGNRMFQGAYLIAQAEEGLIPDIYVQDEQFFADHKDKIRSIYGSGVGHLDQVGIHVRRGDYVRNPFYVDLMETDYYERAMQEFPNSEFIVFSDDIEWCKRQEIFRDCEFSEGDEITDLNRLASCRGIIMANSSFSWWASYLSTDSKVIAPKAWYNDGVERTICPPGWKRI